MEETQLLCGLKREDFQTTIDGKKTDLYVLRNSQGNEVALTNYGGAVVAIMMPDKEGKHANIIHTVNDFLHLLPFFRGDDCFMAILDNFPVLTRDNVIGVGANPFLMCPAD